MKEIKRLTEAQRMALLDIGAADFEGEAYKLAEFDAGHADNKRLRKELHKAGLIFSRAGRGYDGSRLQLTDAGRAALRDAS